MPYPPTIAAFVGAAPTGPLDTPVHLKSQADFTGTFGAVGIDSPMSFAVHLFFENGGVDALVVRVSAPGPLSDVHVSAPSLQAESRGLWALDRADAFSLLCVPPFAFGSSGDIGAATRQAAAAYCRDRRAMFIADPLAAWQEPADLLTGSSGIESAAWGLDRTENAALYFPRLRVSDPLRSSPPLDCAPCGAVAGVYARFDRAKGVWKTPAGREATLRGVSDLTAIVTDQDQARLGASGVNALRTLPGMGPVVWGARTLRGSDALQSPWKYVPVRRLGLLVEDGVGRADAGAALGPGGEPQWEAIRRGAEGVMDSLFRLGAFQGQTPREAWFVRCDRTTTTQADIDQGAVVIVVGFAPLKPAEFVIISIRRQVTAAEV